jgi:hypothetical protein
LLIAVQSEFTGERTMESKIAGMIGAAAALALAGSTQVASASPGPDDVLQARTVAELLQPIPNASVLLAAAEAETVSNHNAARGESPDARDFQAQWHHHHHHHRWWRRRWHHHHHHHHHHW